MVDLTPVETTADPCCAPEQQVACCEPSAKADCCAQDEGCGCAVGASDIREVVRER
jgi:arsenite methyltransferase